MINIQKLAHRAKIYKTMRNRLWIETTTYQRIKMANYMLNNGIVIASATLNLISYSKRGESPGSHVLFRAFNESLPRARVGPDPRPVIDILLAVYPDLSRHTLNWGIVRRGIAIEPTATHEYPHTTYSLDYQLGNGSVFWYFGSYTDQLLVIRNGLVYIAYYD